MEKYIIDNIDSSIYVAEPGSYRLVFSNRRRAGAMGEDAAGAAAEEAAGPASDAKCWNIMFGGGREGPCGFCPYKKLAEAPDEPVVWESEDDSSGKAFHNVSRLIKTPDGRDGIMTQSTDITGYRDRIARIESAKIDYMSRMSHEILTPMNAIVGMSAIAGATDDMQKIKDCLKKIDGASKQLLDIINDIQDISKLEEDRLSLAYENFSLLELLKRISAKISGLAAQKNQEFKVGLDRRAPAAIRTDMQRLSQVIAHLLQNAVKFTPDGGKIRLDVSLSGYVGGRGNKRADIKFIVSDTGIGIPDGKQSGLFDAFEQVDGTKSRAYGGVGLGLAIARRLVALLGGDIRAESGPDGGSVFTFNIVAEVGEGENTDGAGVGDIENIDGADSVNSEILTNNIDFCTCYADGSNEALTAANRGAEAGLGAASARGGAKGAYDGFLPGFNADEALRNLRGKKKLYSAMLNTLKNTTLFDDLRDAMSRNDFVSIRETAKAFSGVAQNLCLSEMAEVLEKVETMARRRIMKPDVADLFEKAAKRIFDGLDSLISALDG